MSSTDQLPLDTPIPTVTGPIPTSEDSYPFATMRYAREPLDLAEYGYVEEEYFLAGDARVFGFDDQDQVVAEGSEKYCTRVLIRCPAEAAKPVTWFSILNASQGYDVEDDWRRAWDYIISNRHAYVAITAKPIQVSALKTFDAERYEPLYWGEKLPEFDASERGWNPFVMIEGSEEGLSWEIMAQAAAWLRSGTGPFTPDLLFMIGQSQSGMYTNTYLSFFHDVFTFGGEKLFDGYLPGVGSVLCKDINQRDSGRPAAAQGELRLRLHFRKIKLPVWLIDPVELDVPVIVTSCAADVGLLSKLGLGSEGFCVGDGPLRRHWHVTQAPHSDVRSRVIPDNSQVVRAKRKPRETDPDFLESVIALPLEPVITASMAAIEKWVREGEAAAPSLWFEVAEGDWVRDKRGQLTGGVTVGLVAEPIADFTPGQKRNPILGSMKLHSRDSILERYGSLEKYQAACDVIDDELEKQGYLEETGRRLMRNVQAELWRRAVDGEAAPASTPQSVV